MNVFSAPEGESEISDKEYKALYKNFSKSWSAFDVAVICTRGRQSSLQIKKWNKHPLGMGGLGYTGVIDPINTR